MPPHNPLAALYLSKSPYYSRLNMGKGGLSPVKKIELPVTDSAGGDERKGSS
ncbi:MAG TPA: hypothetical protein GX744_05855 [Firmicutes bacterium]|jgi:hypothetical protein|nr:hypothetical protein [Bacillota bacterium]